MLGWEWRRQKKEAIKQQLQRMNQKDLRAESKGQVRSQGLQTGGATDKTEKTRTGFSLHTSSYFQDEPDS